MKFSRKPIAAVILSGALSMALAVPAFANTANTSVTLQTDDAQLSVTAPSSISLSMKGDGTFIAPAPSSAKIINNSVMPVAVKSAQVNDVLSGTGLPAATGFIEIVTNANGRPEHVSVDPSEVANSWSLSANGLSLRTSSVNTSGTGWNLKPTNVSGNEIQLTFTGSMMNIDGSVDFSTAKTLGNIVWTFGSKLN